MPSDNQLLTEAYRKIVEDRTHPAKGPLGWNYDEIEQGEAGNHGGAINHQVRPEIQGNITDPYEKMMAQGDNFNESDKQLIVDALWAITPLGGGSPQFHLASRLESAWGVRHNPETVGYLQGLAHQEYTDPESGHPNYRPGELGPHNSPKYTGDSYGIG